MVNADAAGDSGKPVLSVHIESKSKCIGDLELGVDCPWSVETSAAETQFTTTGWNAQPTEPSYTTNTPINPLYPPNGHISSQSQNSSPTTTTQTQDPTPSSSTSETTTAPTLASIGTVAEATRNNGGSGLSSGAVAGIAIGTLIIGAALAFLAAFFLFKRRNKQQQREVNVSRIDYTSYADSTPELVMLQQKGAIVGGLGGRHSPYVQVSQTPIPTPAPVQAQKSAEEEVVALLPPPVGEACVGGRFAALFEEIHRHVETYYRDVHASITPSMEPDLAKFGAEDVDMAKLLHDCSSPTTALKHALVAYVLGITAPKKEGEGKTLFPEELGGMCSSSQADDGSDSNLTAAHSLHRRLTVYLYTSSPSPHSHSNPRLSRHVQCAGRQAAAHFSLTFFPWANPTSNDQHRDEDLTRIIAEALECRIWLFGQPDVYEFEWEGTGMRGVLVSPGLARKTREGEERMIEGIVVGI